MATIDSKEIIDSLIVNNGYFEDDPRVYMIVEYTNFNDKTAWGVTWSNELYYLVERYLEETEYVRHPKIIWQASDHPI